MSTQFHEISDNYLKNTDLIHRKSLGQYFTPKFVREHLISQLPKKKNPKILDPANGTGEFLVTAKKYFGTCELHGWEIDSNLVKLSKKMVPEAKIKCLDSLRQNYQETYDYVIGNPPYFEFKPDYELKHQFKDVINGRSNIFSMFIKLGLDMLKPNGYLAFVIPPSMNNGAYFSKLREYIIERANIEYINILKSSDMFHDAQQTVMIMVLKKHKNKGDYIFSKNNISIFSINPDKLYKAFEGKTTLKELGFTVRTGKVIWNQHKDKLSDNNKNSIPLIWAHNITEQGIILENSDKKPQYIKFDKFDLGPAIIVNRITGAASNVNIKSAVVKPGVKFLGENHVNVIHPPINDDQLTLSLTEKNEYSYETLEKISKAISSPETIKTMQLVTGNTQISKTELENLMPLDL